MTPPKITAILRNTTWESHPTCPGIVLHGAVYDCQYGRPDGTVIYTTCPEEYLGDSVYRTKNSVYKVEFADEKSAKYKPLHLHEKYMNPTPEITGTLKNAVWASLPYPCFYAKIYGDTRNRWDDGRAIWTSEVMENLGDNVFRTENSIYKVEFKEGCENENRPEGL